MPLYFIITQPQEICYNKAMQDTVLTGLRVNSDLTLGNFLGALLPMVRLANQHSATKNINIFIPDLHTVITGVDGELQANLLRSIKYYLAAGLQLNTNLHFYRQSYVPAHSELCWLLDCIATVGETSRMIQYKEKSEGKDSTNVAIFNYPILMAADILLYDAKYVPVGEDQFQHLELTRNLAIRFNRRFGETFTVPVASADQVKFMGLEQAIRIRDLVTPHKKMSKSIPGDNHKIFLSDPPARAQQKILSATTDNEAHIRFDMFNQPGISNLLQIEALVNNLPLQSVITRWAGESSYGELKKQVANSIFNLLTNFQSRLNHISDQQVLSLLQTGEAYANQVANRKLRSVQQRLQLR